MKKYYTKFIYMLLFLAINNLSAQEYTMEEKIGCNYSGRTRGLAWGHEFKNGFTYQDKKYIVALEREYALFYGIVFGSTKQYKTTLAVYMLNKDLNVTKRKMLHPLHPSKSKEIEITEWKKCGDHLLVFFTYENKKDKNTYLFCTSYRLSDWTATTKKICEYKTKDGGKFSISVNNEKQTFSVINRRNKSNLKDQASKLNCTWQYGIYDETIQMIHGNSNADLNAPDNEILISSEVGANGDLIVVTAKVTNLKDKKLTGAVNHKIYIVGQYGTKIVKLKFPGLSNNFIYSTAKYSADSALEVFLMTGPEGEFTNSLYYLNLNRITGKMIDSVHYDYAQDEGDIPQISLKPGVSLGSIFFKISHFNRNPDGSYVFYTEQYYTWTDAVQQSKTVTDKNGFSHTEYSTKLYKHNIYGPGTLFHMDVRNRTSYSCNIQFTKDYVNYDPGHFAVPRLLDKEVYGIYSPESYAICDFTESSVSMKDSKNAKGKNKFYAWMELISMDEGIMQVYRKGGKHLTFSELVVKKTE